MIQFKTEACPCQRISYYLVRWQVLWRKDAISWHISQVCMVEVRVYVTKPVDTGGAGQCSYVGCDVHSFCTTKLAVAFKYH